MGRCFTTTFDNEKKTAVIQGKVSPDNEVVVRMLALLRSKGYQDVSYVMQAEQPRNLRGSRQSSRPRDKAQVEQELRTIAQACNYKAGEQK